MIGILGFFHGGLGKRTLHLASLSAIQAVIVLHMTLTQPHPVGCQLRFLFIQIVVVSRARTRNLLTLTLPYGSIQASNTLYRRHNLSVWALL